MSKDCKRPNYDNFDHVDKICLFLKVNKNLSFQINKKKKNHKKLKKKPASYDVLGFVKNKQNVTTFEEKIWILTIQDNQYF